MSGYLALAKKASKEVSEPSETLAARMERKRQEANRRGLIIRWSEYPIWIKLHDPLTGEWHEVRASECLPSIVEAANRHKRKEEV